MKNGNFEFLIFNYELRKISNFGRQVENFVGFKFRKWRRDDNEPVIRFFSQFFKWCNSFQSKIENFLHLKFKIHNSKLNRPIAFLFPFVLFAQQCVYSQQVTSGADFLRIDSGARSQGMGGAFTAMADDVNSLTWNPAGLAFLQNPEIGYLRMLYFGDIGYNFGGVAFPLQAGENTLGLGAGVINLGTSFDSTGGFAPSVSTGDTAFFASGAYRIKNIFSFGLTAKYVMRSIAGYNAQAFGGDLGLLATPVEHLRLGAGLFNVGQPVQFISASDPLPMTGRLGVAYQVLDIPHHSIVLSVDGSYLIQAQAFLGGAGVEYWLDKTFAVRGGYTGDAYQQHWTAGLGLNVNVFQLDYAYAPAGTLGDTHRISFILRFGTEGASLAAPSGFTANPLDGAMNLSWKPSSSADVVGYNLYVKRPGADTFAKVTRQPMNGTSVKLGHLQNGMNYSFAVASVSAAGRESSMTRLSAMPGEAKATAPVGPVLSAPTGLKVSAAGEGLQLTWDKAASGDVVGFNLYLADDQGKPSKKLTAQLVKENHVNLKKVNPDKLYQFVLTAVDKAGNESMPTAAAQAKLADLRNAVTAALLPPAHFVVEGGDGLAHLSWDTVSGAVGYHLYTSDDGKNFSRLTKNGPKDLQKVILRPLKNGKTYYFAVTSVSTTGQESDKVVQSVVPSSK